MIFSGYYKYEKTFSEDASIQGYDMELEGDVLTPELRMSMLELPAKDQKQMKKEIKIA